MQGSLIGLAITRVNWSHANKRTHTCRAASEAQQAMSIIYGGNSNVCNVNNCKYTTFHSVANYADENASGTEEDHLSLGLTYPVLP